METPYENSNQYNTGIDNITRPLTIPSTLTTQPNRANRFQHLSYSMPSTTNTYGGNGHFTNCIYQGNQKRKNGYHKALLRTSTTSHNGLGFHHRGSPRSSNLFCNTDPH